MVEDMTLPIEAAAPSDLEDVRRLLEHVDLPTNGLEDHFPHGYVVGHIENDIVAAAGLERHGDYGLLRSVAVADALRGRGLGRAVVANRLDAARLAGLRGVYLLTTTAKDYFAELGFVDTPRATVPPEIAGSVEFREACPASADCLALTFDRT
jgi:N-acetylglutamate synthase-like GNAT family acetyltransferase